MLQPVRVVAKARIRRNLLASGDLAEARELGVVADRENDVAVRRREHLVGHDVRVGVAVALRDLARAPEIEDLVGVERDDGVEQRHVDVLPDAGRIAMAQGRHHGQRGVHAGDHVGHRDADLLRAAAREVVALAGDAHQSAHALEDEVVAGARRVRAVLSESGDRAIDQPRIDLAQIVVGEAVARQVADLVVLDDDVATSPRDRAAAPAPRASRCRASPISCRGSPRGNTRPRGCRGPRRPSSRADPRCGCRRRARDARS